MSGEKDLLDQLRTRIAAKNYRVRIHAVRHMVEEGFTEENIVEAVVGRSKMLEDYPYENRCLVLGYFSISKNVRSPLHIVCDYSCKEVVDIVTA